MVGNCVTKIKTGLTESKAPAGPRPTPVQPQPVAQTVPGNWQALLQQVQIWLPIFISLPETRTLFQLHPASRVNLDAKVDELLLRELLWHLQLMRCNGLKLGMWHSHPVNVLPLVPPALLEKPCGF